MAEISRIRCTWTGFNGAPGVTTFFYSGTDYTPMLNGLATFFTQWKSAMPTGSTVTVPSSGDIIDEATGVLTGAWTHGTDQVITGTSNVTYPGGVGVMVRWHTSVIKNGRRVQGRTYLVPFIGANYDGVGNVLASTQTLVTNAANALVSAAAGGLVVWHRPKGAGGGSAAAVTDGVCAPKPALLRSRRD